MRYKPNLGNFDTGDLVQKSNLIEEEEEQESVDKGADDSEEVEELEDVDEYSDKYVDKE